MSATATAAPTINQSTHPLPFPLLSWIDSHRSQLQPPVGNAMIYNAGQFKIMVVGGPNIRTDYHINRGEEWFYMLKGDMVLKVVDGGVMRDVVIREGDVFLLPGDTPHSPQRLADTLGIVIEREREEAELDGLRWYCHGCDGVVHEDFFRCVDLGKQLKDKINAYYADERQRTCRQCGVVDEVPSVDRSKIRTVEDIITATSRRKALPTSDENRAEGTYTHAEPAADGTPLRVDHDAFSSVIVSSGRSTTVPPHTAINPATHPAPFSLPQFIARHAASLRPPVSNKLLWGGAACEYQIQIVGGPNRRTDYHIEDGEEWFYQLKGDMLLKVVDGGQATDIHIREGQSFLLPPHVPHSPQRFDDTIGLVVELRRKAGWVDGLRWYCRQPGCGAVVQDERFQCTDLGSQLKQIIEGYYGDEGKRRCNKCGAVDQPPVKALAQDESKEERKEQRAGRDGSRQPMK